MVTMDYEGVKNLRTNQFFRRIYCYFYQSNVLNCCTINFVGLDPDEELKQVRRNVGKTRNPLEKTGKNTLVSTIHSRKNSLKDRISL